MSQTSLGRIQSARPARPQRRLTSERPIERRAAVPDVNHVPSERALGQSESNFNVDSAAGELARIFRKTEGLPSSISEGEMIDDNARAYFNRYCRFLSSRVIPKNADENLMPKNPDNTGMLVTATLSIYIGNHLKQVQRLFPDNPNWKNLDQPPWWTKMRKEFETECDRFQQTYSGDAVFGLGGCFPIYRCINDPPLSVTTETHLEDYVSAIDLRYILRKLASECTMAGNKRCLDRVLVGLTHYAIGRGGEIKFQNFNDWSWDPMLMCLDPQWHEIKVIDTYPMPLIPEKEFWETDVYHQLACYFCVENGLFRTRLHRANGQLNTAFPDLQKSSDNYVTRKISTIIRRTLPAGCPESVAGGYTAKSCRKGSITGMSMHPKMNTLRIAARSGHSTGTSMDSYLDKSNPARCLHAAIAAAGWQNVEQPISPYRLESIGNDEETSKLMRKLFACSVPHFNIGGKLRVVLKTCAAALIMYHPQVTRDLGPSSAISTKVRNAARQAEIKDARFPNLSPELVVDEWAKLVSRDFKMMNTEIADVGSDAASIADGMNTLLRMNQTMSTNMSTLMNNNEALVLELASSKARITALEHTGNFLRGQLRNANHKLSVLRTPEKANSTPPTKRAPPPLDAVDVDAVDVDDDDDDDVVVVSPQEAEKKRESVASRLQYGAAAREKAEAARKKSSMQFGNALYDLAQDDVLCSPFSQTTLWKGFKEAHRMKHCFDLADFIDCAEDKRVLLDPKADATDRLQAAENIEHECASKLLEFEGTTLEIEKKNKRARKKNTFIAFGDRVVTYKKRIIAASVKTAYKDVKLVELSELRLMEKNKGATLPAKMGNHPVNRYFKPVPTKRRRITPRITPTIVSQQDEEAAAAKADGIGDVGIY